jgi:methyl-accepting chemotaxis protein
MKISHKIILLVVFLLGILTANTLISLHQIENIRREFSILTKYDMALVEEAGAIHRIQLEKAVLLQKLIGIAEELGFEQVNFARKEYLQGQLSDMGKQLQIYQQEMSKKLISARSHAYRRMKHQGLISNIEGRLKRYDELVTGILQAINKGGFQLSLEDLENLQSQENAVTADVSQLLKDVQEWAQIALTKANHVQDEARSILQFGMTISIAVSILLVIWILFSIIRPLNNLTSAAKRIGEGDFKVNLDASSQDEIAKAAEAFNIMGRQLEEFKNQLESRNQTLKDTNEDLDKFIAMMGHDILSPLTGMLAYCAYIEKHAAHLDPQSQEALQGIRKSATKMHQMVKDLLKFTESKRLKT